ncbi:hypothetical protein L1049_010194 [Liquidambar formosana]|uniref:Uncharacterized protein n=1 Tax=Liquidambar formosana TaxID=63359 RepID=A0AAP0N782_LIQFO
MRRSEAESVDHLFLHCSIARFLWLKLFHIASISWVSPRDCCISMFLVDFSVLSVSKRALILWISAILAIFWIIWLERNARIFKDRFEEVESTGSDFIFGCFLGIYFQRVLGGSFFASNWRAVCGI